MKNETVDYSQTRHLKSFTTNKTNAWELELMTVKFSERFHSCRLSDPALNVPENMRMRSIKERTIRSIKSGGVLETPSVNY